MTSKPSLEAVQDFARKAIDATAGLVDEAKKELENVIAEMKGTNSENTAEIDARAKVRESNVVVEDLNVFKAGLIPSKAAMPLEPLTVAAKL